MAKRFLSFILSICLVLSLCGCDKPENMSVESVSGNPKASGNACEALFERVQAYEETAKIQSDVGMTLSGEFFYGMAQAEISSLRLCIDTVLWLLGEGESLDDVIGNAPYKDWDSITATGLGSDAPLYFEGLIYTFRGKDAEAENCYQKASAYPNHVERDFYYLRNESVENLYALREQVLTIEKEVSNHFSPRAQMVADRTGAEFFPAYHLVMAKEVSDPQTAKQCAMNALMANPQEPSLYAAAAIYAMNAQDPSLGCELLNEGLFLWPKDDLLNFLGAVYSYSAGDVGLSKEFLAVAKESQNEHIKEYVSALENEISRQPVRLKSVSLTLQEQSWMQLLRPSSLPNVASVTSYPVELQVAFPQFTPVTFEGKLTFNGQITDEQIMNALKSALSAVSEYKSLDDVTRDKANVDAILERLKFTPEDQDRIIHNWLSLIGYDKMYDLVRAKIPTLDAYDGVSALIGKMDEAAQEFGFDGLPDEANMLIAGIMVSIKEYQEDQKKYKDIVELSNARGRIREFYDKVNSLLRDEMAKNMHWTIRVFQQKFMEETFDYAYEIKAPYLYTADIELVKEGGDFSSFTGTYVGDFYLKLAADLSDYDKIFCQRVADQYTENAKKGQLNHTYNAISTTINRPSESECYVKGEGVSVTLSMPYGTNRMKFELPLDATKMESKSKVLIDKSYTYGYSGKDMSETITHTRIEDSETGTSHLWIYRVVTVKGYSQSFAEEQEGTVGDMDVRPYLKMNLVIDTRVEK